MGEKSVMDAYIPFAQFQELLTHDHFFFPVILSLPYYFEANPRHSGTSYVNTTACNS